MNSKKVGAPQGLPTFFCTALFYKTVGPKLPGAPEGKPRCRAGKIHLARPRRPLLARMRRQFTERDRQLLCGCGGGALTAACAHLFHSRTRGSRKKTPGTAAFLSGKPRAGPGAKIIRGREQRKKERKAADCRPMRRQGGAGVRCGKAEWGGRRRRAARRYSSGIISPRPAKTKSARTALFS